jgi:homoserine kinase
LKEFVAQSANLALVLAGCFRGDAQLVRAGLCDVLVEPRRAALIPGFARVKQAALDAGALGASISGAGPSVFAWFDSREGAERAAPAMRNGFASVDGIDSDAFVSPVAGPAAELVP